MRSSGGIKMNQLGIFDAAPLNARRVVTLNLGLGRDSFAMLCLLAERSLWVDGRAIGPGDVDCVVFSDTGREWDHSHALIPKARAMCAAMGVRFLILAKGGDGEKLAAPSSWSDIEARADAGLYHARPDIVTDLNSRKTVVSLGKGDCTDVHKIRPIRKLINDISRLRFGLNNIQWPSAIRRGERVRHITIIGIAADESSRADKSIAMEESGRAPKFVTESYPLISMGIAKADEGKILARFGLEAVRKSGCYMCPYQPLSAYWALSIVNPEAWADVQRYEAESIAANPNISINGTKLKGIVLTIGEQVDRWRASNPDATVDAVLNKSYSRCDKAAREQRKHDRATVTVAVGHRSLMAA